jgi:hypothetical protein
VSQRCDFVEKVGALRAAWGALPLVVRVPRYLRKKPIPAMASRTQRDNGPTNTEDRAKGAQRRPKDFFEIQSEKKQIRSTNPVLATKSIHWNPSLDESSVIRRDWVIGKAVERVRGHSSTAGSSIA